MKGGLVAVLVMVLLLAAMVALYLSLGEGPAKGGTAELPAKGPLTVRLLSWNVGNSVDADFAPARDDDLEHIAQVIRDAQADIVCLQEIANDRQLQRLREGISAAYQAFAAPRRGSHYAARLIVILVSPDVPVVGSEVLQCIKGNDVLVVRLPRKVHLLGVHADAFDPVRRRHMVEAIASWVEHPDRLGSPMILLGDMNLDVEVPALGAEAGALHDGESYSLLAQRFRDAGLKAGATAAGDRRLDYIFIRPHELPLDGAWVWIKKSRGEMDHLPLVVDLTAAGIAGRVSASGA